VIVFWNHNWEDCPLEVVELRKEIQGWRERIGRAAKNPVATREGFESVSAVLKPLSRSLL
jgi:hypothetical protein